MHSYNRRPIYDFIAHNRPRGVPIECERDELPALRHYVGDLGGAGDVTWRVERNVSRGCEQLFVDHDLRITRCARSSDRP